jgi:hypothetical protein
MRRVVPFLFVAGVLAAGCSRAPAPAVPVAPVAGPGPDPAAGLTIERVVEAEQYYRLIDVNAMVFKYTGGLVDCWVEEQIDGKPRPHLYRLGEEFRGQVTAAKAAGLPTNSGFVVVVRRKAEGQERWDVKLLIDRPTGGPLGGTFYDIPSKVSGASLAVEPLDKPREVTGEVELLRVASPAPTGESSLCVKCAPWKGDPR